MPMTKEAETVLLIKGVISEMSQEQQLAVKSAIERIEAIIIENEIAGGMAVVLLGATFAAQV